MAKRGEISRSTFALMITGSGMDMDKISGMLDMQPTRVIYKGDLLNRLPEIIANEDEWILITQLENPQGRDDILGGLLKKLISKKKELSEIAEFGQVRLRLRVQSDYVEVSYSLMPETVELMFELGLPLDISTVSWGEVGL